MTMHNALHTPARRLAPCLAPADTRAGRGAGAAAPPSRVAEIVTFRLKPGTDEAAFLRAAQTTEAPVAAQPGFLRRTLSRDDTGLWTDYVEWEDLASARAAAETMMSLPEFGIFVDAIDPGGMVMRHAAVLRSIGN